MKIEEGIALLNKYDVPFVEIDGIPTVEMNDLSDLEKERVIRMRAIELKNQYYSGIHYVPSGNHDSHYITMEGRGIMEYFDQKLMIIKND